jgi:hypothetical protein
MHTIRLREPWDVEPAAGGLKRHRRFFNKPTNLSAGEQVWIVVEGAAHFVELTLNGSPPPHAGAQQSSGQGTAADSATRAYDVTTLLNLRNELVIVTEEASTAARGEVRLEIRAVE